MDIERLHESMNAVPAVMRVVQAIEPISHAPIAQDVVESFIILLNQLGDDLVFFFRFWDISLQPLIIGCSRNTDLTTQPAKCPSPFLRGTAGLLHRLWHGAACRVSPPFQGFQFFKK